MSHLIFFGSDQYSAIVIDKLIASQKFAHITIVTDRGKPKDREQAVEPNPVEKLANQHNIKVLHYPTNQDEMSKFISILKVELSNIPPLGLCTSFDHLVPAEIIELFNGHLYNLHPSLLPQYRNVAPIQYALALGDSETGITLFKISTGIDNGEIVGQVQEPVLPTDITPTLSTRLFKKGAELFLELMQNKLTPLPSAISTPTPAKLIFTRRLTRDSGHIEWPVLQKLVENKLVTKEETTNHLLKLRLSRSTQDPQSILHDLVHALTPWPGVWTIIPTKKGDLRLSIESVLPNLTVKLAGKPKGIAWQEFVKYYL
jgi:methionyl-tRNA formyltransferase